LAKHSGALSSSEVADVTVEQDFEREKEKEKEKEYKRESVLCCVVEMQCKILKTLLSKAVEKSPDFFNFLQIFLKFPSKR
jgi:hypothetical protein